MKVRLRNVVEDQDVIRHKGIPPVEGWDVKGESFFLDGPVCRRVAVVDFHESGGKLLPGLPFRPPGGGRKLGAYPVDESNLTSREFIQLSVFSTVLKTLYMFEEEDTLGREVTWAFGAPQLLVVPVAGDRANAFYERDSHSLQFFFFRPGPNQTVYTALSQDIVAHETAHAILDGVAPDLYHALTPQSLALHEAIADLAAVMMSFRSDPLREALLRQTNGSIAGDTAFSWLAQEFGRLRGGTGRSGYLRSMWNERSLDPNDSSRDAQGEPNFVDPRSGPHDLSQVLAGALYRVAHHLHEEYKAILAAETGNSELSVSGKALFLSTEHFQRLVFRALDYLPPGELSFTDYARAILAADLASHPEDSIGRDTLKNEFQKRAISAADDFHIETNFEHDAVRNLDLERLVESDWVAYAFANEYRDLLNIPAKIHFRVRPRLDSKKTFYLKGGKKTVRECIFKVSWDVEEPNPPGGRLTQRRQITAGTMLAIDWETRKIRALLSSHVAVERPESGERRRDRDSMLRRLAADGQLQMMSAAGASQAVLDHGVRVEIAADLMRVRGSGRLLHIVD